jgi:hypothetical protein
LRNAFSGTWIAELREPVEHLEHLEPVWRQHRDALALDDAVAGKPGGDGVRARVDLGDREPCALDVAERPVRVTLRARAEQ